VLRRRAVPGGVVPELVGVRARAAGDGAAAAGPRHGAVAGLGGGERGARPERRRHEAHAHVVGPHLVRHRRRHRGRDLRAHGAGGQGGRRPRRRRLLRRLRRLRHALRLLLHRVRRRDPRRRYTIIFVHMHNRSVITVVSIDLTHLRIPAASIEINLIISRSR
jgi:hypothetical protein